MSKNVSVSDARAREQEDGGKVEIGARIDGGRKVEETTDGGRKQRVDVAVKQSEI